MPTETRTAATLRMPRSDRRTLSQRVADTLMAHIIESELVPGDRMPTEPELEEQFGVSRTVVREAGRILVARGIVSIRPRLGMVVAEFDQSNLTLQVANMLHLGGGTFRDLMELRRIVEPDMTACAALRRTDRDVADLLRLAGSLDTDDTAPGSTAEERITADLEFHNTVARSTQNPFFAHLMEPINTILHATYIGSPGYTPEQSNTYAEHLQIAQAIADGDPVAARRTTLAHLERVTNATRTLVPPGRIRGEA